MTQQQPVQKTNEELTEEERHRKITTLREKTVTLSSMITHYAIVTEALNIEKQLLQNEIDQLYSIERKLAEKKTQGDK